MIDHPFLKLTASSPHFPTFTFTLPSFSSSNSSLLIFLFTFSTLSLSLSLSVRDEQQKERNENPAKCTVNQGLQFPTVSFFERVERKRPRKKGKEKEREKRKKGKEKETDRKWNERMEFFIQKTFHCHQHFITFSFSSFCYNSSISPHSLAHPFYLSFLSLSVSVLSFSLFSLSLTIIFRTGLGSGVRFESGVKPLIEMNCFRLTSFSLSLSFSFCSLCLLIFSLLFPSLFFFVILSISLSQLVDYHQ